MTSAAPKLPSDLRERLEFIGLDADGLAAVAAISPM